MADFTDILNEGCVFVKKLGRLKKNWLVLCQASSRGPNRLERYMDETTAAYQMNGKITPMKDVLNVSMDSSTKKFVVSLKSNENRAFICETNEEASQWVQLLRRLRWQDEGRTLHGDKRLHNVFHVSLVPNCLLHHSGESKLEVSSAEIILKDFNSKKVASWPLTSLRRFGGDNTRFTFECGRSCETGEGTFILNTYEAELIQKRVFTATEELTKHSY